MDMEQTEIDPLEGIWRLVDSRAWVGQSDRLRPNAPYGWYPMGYIAFSEGHMLAAVCNGDADVGPDGDLASAPMAVPTASTERRSTYIPHFVRRNNSQFPVVKSAVQGLVG